MKFFVELICFVCNICSEVNMLMSKQVELYIKISIDEIVVCFEVNCLYVECFMNLSVLKIGMGIEIVDKVMMVVVLGVEVIFLFEGLINIDEEIVCL